MRLSLRRRMIPGNMIWGLTMHYRAFPLDRSGGYIAAQPAAIIGVGTNEAAFTALPTFIMDSAARPSDC